MKTFLFAVCLIGVAAAEISLHAVFQAKWNVFKATHGKAYHKHEEPERLNNFLTNTLAIEAHNERFHKGLETYELGHNEHSDMSPEEFQVKRTGALTTTLESIQNVTLHQVRDRGVGAPASIDWRGALPPIKNQHQCGSCYTYGAIAALEAQVYRKTRQVVALSEQEALDCTYGTNNGCNGGWIHHVFEYVKRVGGVVTERDRPYQNRVQACNPRGTRHGRITSYVKVANNERAMIDALATVGPVAISMHTCMFNLRFYRSGVYNEPGCSGGRTDHIITIVGYGTNERGPYYLVRNSWGTSWGQHGYMQMSRNIPYINAYGYYPVM